MVYVIQSSYFTKNGIAEFDCNNVSLTNEVRCEAVVTFIGADIGGIAWANFIIQNPNGVVFNSFSGFSTIAATTIFMSADPIQNLIPGKYTLKGVEVFTV